MSASDGGRGSEPRVGGVRFAGYAAIFHRVDRAGDIIKPGAFVPVPAAGQVPLLWNHDDGRPAGVIETIAEDARGLRVTARARGVKPGMGLSFGFRVRDADYRTYRELKALELIEVSLVASPMQPLARVHAVEEAGGGD